MSIPMVRLVCGLVPFCIAHGAACLSPTDDGDGRPAGSDASEGEGEGESESEDEGEGEPVRPVYCDSESECIREIGLGCGRTTISPWEPVRASNGALLASNGFHDSICACFGMTVPSLVDFAAWAQTHGAVGQVSGPGENTQLITYAKWDQYYSWLPESDDELYFNSTGFTSPLIGPEFEQALFFTSDGDYFDDEDFTWLFWPEAPMSTWHFQKMDHPLYWYNVMCVPKTPARRRVRPVVSDPTVYPDSPFLAGGETCATATALPAGTTINGTLAGAEGDHYLIGSFEDPTATCSSINAAGFVDVAYRVEVPEGKALRVTVQADDAFFDVNILDDADNCFDLGECLAKYDNGAGGDYQHIVEVSWTNTAASANEIIVLIHSSRESHFELTTRLD